MLALLLSLGPAHAELPLPTYPECGEPARTDLCPQELGDDWQRISWIPDSAVESVRPIELELGPGLSVDKAWAVHTGTWETRVAIADSGILWEQRDLINKVHLNLGELPPPQRADGSEADSYDLDGNGLVNVQDYAEDPRVDWDAGVDAADGLLDPSDLIYSLSDGVDDDGNGYIDDIAGWDFFSDDNDPWATLDIGYGEHGTGVMRDVAAEGGNGGVIGVCPNCALVPLRIGDTFVTDGARAGRAIAYAADLDVDVMAMAIGALSHPAETTAAMEYATAQDMLIVAAAADENAYHHNMPGTYGDALYVHSVRTDTPDPDSAAYSFMNFLNCNNYGPRVDMVAGSQGCATGSVAMIAGMAGLTLSAAREQGLGLSALELRQLMIRSVDDVWLTPEELEIAETYPSSEGYDPFYGYGRANADIAMQRVLEGRIPPVARLTAPEWFVTLDPQDMDSVSVELALSAPYAAQVDWVLEWGQGWEPSSWATVDAGTVGGETALSVEFDLSQVALTPILEPEDDEGVLERVERVHQPAVTLRLRATDEAGDWGEARRTFFVYEDPDRLPGFPVALGASAESSPILVDLDGDGIMEILTATSSGVVTAWKGDGTPASGWPVATEASVLMASHGAAPAARAMPPWPEGIMATVAAGDIDGDGQIEVVAAGLEGRVYAWGPDGVPEPGFPVSLESRPREDYDRTHLWDIGAMSAPTLADLDGDGALEIVLGGLDSRLYAWRGSGEAFPGYPIELCHPDNCGSLSARIVSGVTVDDLDGDGDLDLLVGSNETTRSGGFSASHAIDALTGAPLEGWPKEESGLVAYAAVLPIVGEGHPATPAVAELDGQPGLELMDPVMLGQVPLRHFNNEVFHELKYAADGFGDDSNADEPALVVLANNPAFGDVDGDGVRDVFVGGAGMYALVGLALNKAVDFQHLIGGWSGATGEALPGWPRQVEDFQFLMSPAIADLSGDGRAEVIYGSAGYVLHAWDAAGASPEGWPKFTGHWILGSPAVGDVDGDGYLDVVVTTREGWLFAWRTQGRADQEVQWASVHHDPQNTSSARTPLQAQAGPPDVDARRCGCAGRAGVGSGWAWLLGLLVAARRRGGLEG